MSYSVNVQMVLKEGGSSVSLWASIGIPGRFGSAWSPPTVLTRRSKDTMWILLRRILHAPRGSR